MSKRMVNIKKAIFSVFLATAFFLIPSSTWATTYIVFRYDDFSADKPGMRGSNEERRRIWKAEQETDSLFVKYGLEYVIAIIPKANETSFEQDREKAEFIKSGISASRIEVAQHGFSHTNYAPLMHIKGEFRERNYECQLRDITMGKKILCSSCDLENISTFVPPYNGWDSNTATILEQTGFTILSADRFLYYKSVKGLTIIPWTASLQELESVVNEGRLPHDGIIVVLFHPREIAKLEGREDYKGYYFGIDRFDKLLFRISKMPEVQIVTLEHLPQKCTDLTLERYRMANQLLRQRYFWKSLLPEHLLPGVKKHEFYLSLVEYSKSLLPWRVAAICLVIVLFVVGLIIRRFFSLILAAKWRFRADVIATLLFSLSALKEIQIIHKGWHITAISAIPAFLTASFVLALLLQAVKRVLLRKRGTYSLG